MNEVAVIIPSFNHDRYIGASISSVIHQTYKGVEITVVDDGSTDKTLEVLERYCRDIRVIQQENQGTQAARNTGIRASTGKYIALLDSDDMWLPDKLEQQIDILDKYPDVGLVYSLAYKIDDNGKYLTNDPIGRPLAPNIPILEQLLIQNPIPALTAVFRRECIDEIGFFDESLLGAGDFDMWLRIAGNWEVACIPEPLALYRVHSQNTTQVLQRNKQAYREHRQALEKAFLLFPDKISEEVRRKALARTHLIEAESEAVQGCIPGISKALFRAFTLDPDLYINSDDWFPSLLYWANLCCGENSADEYKEFGRIVFDKKRYAIPKVSRLESRLLSELAMSDVFKNHRGMERQRLRSLILLGLKNNPKWLRNKGVWSIIAEAFLGISISEQLRNVLSIFKKN